MHQPHAQPGLILLTQDQLQTLIRKAVADGITDAEARQQDELTAEQVVSMKRVRTSVVLTALKEGRLKATRRGRRWVIKRTDADAWTPV